MKRFAIAAFLMIGATGAAWSAQPVAFHGSVWSNGGVGLAFDQTIAPGQTRTFRLTGGQVIEMSVDSEGRSKVRLLDREGLELHASVEQAGVASRKFMYALCRRGQVAYSCPPANKSGCP